MQGIEVGQHFSLETALNIYNFKLFRIEKSEKACNISCLQVFGARNRSPSFVSVVELGFDLSHMQEFSFELKKPEMN